MKKASAAILLTLYLAFSSGVVVSYHYCMNEFSSFKLGNSKTDICAKCGMHTKKSGCCHDEVKIVKLQDDQQASLLNFKLLSPAILAAPIAFFNEPVFTGNKKSALNSHSPPSGKQDTYLLNCVFRI